MNNSKDGKARRQSELKIPKSLVTYLQGLIQKTIPVLKALSNEPRDSRQIIQMHGYLLILALAAEEVEEVDDDAGHHQDLQVVVLPIGSLKGEANIEAIGEMS